VPRLEVEAGAAGLPGGLAAGQPRALAELVADRLPGDAQVADQLAVEELRVAAGVLAVEGPGQLRRPRLAPMLGERAVGVGLCAGYVGLVSFAFPGTWAGLSPLWSALCMAWAVAVVVLATRPSRSELGELRGEVVEAQRAL
jgi:hypothetical protein